MTLSVNMPKTRALQILKDYWSWVPVTFLQERLGVVSYGFAKFLEEMEQEDLVELNETKTKVRFVRPDYGLAARTLDYFSHAWYAWLVTITFFLCLFYTDPHSYTGVAIVIAVFMTAPLITLFHIIRNALKK